MYNKDVKIRLINLLTDYNRRLNDTNFMAIQAVMMMNAYFCALGDLGYIVLVSPKEGKVKSVKVLQGTTEIDSFEI